MSCPVQSRETAELLLDYCARRLDADAALRLDRHVAQCPACQEFVAGQRMVADALEAYERYAVPAVSDDFDRLLYARIEAEQESGWWKRAWRRVFQGGEPLYWKPAVSVAMACLVVAGGLMLRQSWTSSEEASEAEPVESAAQVNKQEIEGLNQALEDLEMLAVLGTPDKDAPARN